MRILGVDPGLANTGWSVVDVQGQRYRPVCYGVIKTAAGDPVEERIHRIAGEIASVAKENGCTVCGMEDVFFTKNISSAIPVAKVIGALTYALYDEGIEVRMFTPPQIKIAVVGVGNADKNQVQQMVRLLTGMDAIIKSDHTADSVAAAITCSVHLATEGRVLK